MMKIRKRMTTVIGRTVALMIVVGFLVNAGYAQEKGRARAMKPSRNSKGEEAERQEVSHHENPQA